VGAADPPGKAPRIAGKRDDRWRRALKDFHAVLLDGGANSTGRDAGFVSGGAAITFNSIASLRGYIKSAKDANKRVVVGVAYIPRPADDPRAALLKTTDS